MLNNINVGSVPSNIWNTILCCIYLFDYLYRDKRIAHMPLKQYDFLLQYIYRTTFSMLIISDGHHYLSWWVMASDGGTGAQWSGADQCLRCLRWWRSSVVGAVVTILSPGLSSHCHPCPQSCDHRQPRICSTPAFTKHPPTTKSQATVTFK